jgi:F-type H+-transporting ATPase subunit b
VRTRNTGLMARGFVAAVGIGVVATFAMAAPASAKPATKAATECIDKLENGGSIDDCQKAPSPLKPENNEIIWGSISFLVLLVAMWKFGVPAVKNMEKAREDRIRNDLESAERAKAEGEAALAQYQAQIGDARNEGARIIDEARQSADGVRRELIARAEEEAAQLRARAADELRLQIDRATADLRQQVAAMSVELAGKIVERNLDASTQQQLIESYINSVGSN